MTTYLCKFLDNDYVHPLLEYKECKKTYKYVVSERKISNYGYNWKPVDTEYRLKKEKLADLGFFVEAETEEEALVKRKTRLLEILKEDMKAFRERVINFFKDNDDKIFGIELNNLDRQPNYNIIPIMTDFTKRILAFKTKVKIPEKRICDISQYDYEKESREIYEYLEDQYNALLGYIVINYNLAYKIKTASSKFGNAMVNLKHKDILLKLESPLELIVESMKATTDYYSRKFSEFNLSIESKTNYYSDNIPFHYVADLYPQLMKEFHDRISDDLDYVQILGNGINVHYIGKDKIKQLHPSNCNVIKTFMAYLEHAKKLDIGIELGNLWFYASKDFIFEHFRLKPDGTITAKLDGDNEQLFYCDYCNQELIAELKRQLGRDNWNAFKLISEVGK